MSLDESAGSVICPSCDESTPIEEVPNKTCPHCGAKIPDDADTILRMDHVDQDRLGAYLSDPDNSPSGGVDYSADEISRPERDVGALNEALFEAEKGDVLHASIGIAQDETTANFYVISHERDVDGYAHRIGFIERPREDGMTRLYRTVLEDESDTDEDATDDGDLDPWQVNSLPYEVETKTIFIEDYAGAGWMITAKIVN